jgi:CopG family transcriptional regulator, nickel-responsive regulator
MSELCRIGISVDSDLLERFDAFIGAQGYTNRSEAFRDLVRDRLIRQTVQSPQEEVVGTITLVYDHHVRLLPEKLTELQHDHQRVIVSSLHVHLDHDNCLEVLVVRGKSGEVRKLANLLTSPRGVKHGQLTVTTPHMHEVAGSHSQHGQ